MITCTPKLWRFSKKNHITLLYDDIYPIKENGKFVRAKGQKFIVLKRALSDKVDIILTILHECSHAINDNVTKLKTISA